MEPLSRPRPPRNLVLRSDGKTVNVARKRGQLFVCASGCCCGHVERGHAAVPTDLYHQEWERRRLRNQVHLTIGGCLGPCPLANVVLLIFDGHEIWLHSINSEPLVLAIYDYVDQMLAADAYLPPPMALVPYRFDVFGWEANAAAARPARQDRVSAAAEEPGFLILTQADTDLLALQAALNRLPADFPPVRAANLSNLQSDADVDAFLDHALPQAAVVVLRLLGGRTSFARGLDRLAAWARDEDGWLVCVSGTEPPDPDLLGASTTGVPVALDAYSYLQLGGVANCEHLLRFLSDHLLASGYGYDAPTPQPRHGIYHPDLAEPTLAAWQQRADPRRPTFGVLFYRSHYLAGNLAFIDALVRAGEAAGANVLPVYAYSLKDDADPASDASLPAPLRYFVDGDRPRIDVLITTTSFAMGGVNPDGPTPSGWAVDALARLDRPVLQAITAGGPIHGWAESLRGLSPLDTAMNVAIPEFDGRIIGVPISFKEQVAAPARGDGVSLGAPVVQYGPVADRVERLIGLALRLAALRRKPNADKRIAFVLTNSPAKAARIGNAVGLDAPASLLRLFDAMREAGYQIDGVPETGDALIHALIDRGCYDVELLTSWQIDHAAARVPDRDYAEWFAALPARNQAEMAVRWGGPPGTAYVHAGHLALAGLRFGNVFIALQPPRGYGMDPSLIYHVPDLPPPHPYHALYRWLRDPAGFGADAIVHVGKHGTLEWLPGKGVGLSQTCYPDQFLADLPLVYPFIINDPGEGAQAKRRAHAVVVDHLTPPMTTAGAYGELAELAQLVDEYYQVEALDPGKLPVLQAQIWGVIQRAHLDQDLALIRNRNHGDHTHPWDEDLTPDGTPVALEELRGKDVAHLLEDIDGYLCELGGLQIRDGLHVLGTLPAGEQLVDLLQALTRLPNLDVPSLPAAIARAHGVPYDDLLAAPGARYVGPPLPGASGDAPTTNGDALAWLDGEAHARLAAAVAGQDGRDEPPEVAATLAFVTTELLPRLRQTQAEIDHVLRALDGRYVPAGPSGAPTRGMAHVLPTGRNFYAVDPRALPSAAAWQVGQQLADALLQRYLADEGRYPERVGLVVWGTSAMRTHGDDLAEIFSLLGVRPRWQRENHRLIGVEAIPLATLGRPRIDVVCRISGFFRDAFPHLVTLLDQAVRLVADLDEPADQNYVRRRTLAERDRLIAAGIPEDVAQERAHYRIFGCPPGAYGAGILPLIDERNWHDLADFAAAYVAWGGYAYTETAYGVDARDDFREALRTVVVAAKNQDNREHDLFDSDDYLQYHGGMIASIRAISGKLPRRYFGDSADPARPRVRDLREEALRVFRGRVVNPKWLASIRRHGYKGALEQTATVDFLFGYDATADVVEDWMYERVTQSYLLDPENAAFLRRANPWAFRDVAERLLEAIQRGLWEKPSAEVREALQQAYLTGEADLEGRSEGRQG